MLLVPVPGPHRDRDGHRGGFSRLESGTTTWCPCRFPPRKKKKKKKKVSVEWRYLLSSAATVPKGKLRCPFISDILLISNN